MLCALNIKSVFYIIKVIIALILTSKSLSVDFTLVILKIYDFGYISVFIP